MVIKAALLDAPASSGKGVFVRMDELADEAALTDRHVAAIKSCDLPADRYVWVPADVDERHPFGGEFVDKAVLEQRNAPDFDVGFQDLCAAIEAAGTPLPPTTKSWLDYMASRRKRVGARRKQRGGPR